jgi:hypothetical protein
MLSKLKAVYKLLFCKEYILYIKTNETKNIVSVFISCKSNVQFHQQVASDIIDSAKTRIAEEQAVLVTKQIINNYN